MGSGTGRLGDDGGARGVGGGRNWEERTWKSSTFRNGQRRLRFSPRTADSPFPMPRRRRVQLIRPFADVVVVPPVKSTWGQRCYPLQLWKRATDGATTFCSEDRCQACQRAPDRRRAVGLVSKDIMLTMQNVRDLRPRDGAIRGALPAATSLAPFIEIRHACAAIPAGRALHRLEHTQTHILSCSTAIHFRPHAASGPMLHSTRTTTPRCIQKSRQGPDLPVPSATCISRIRHGRRTVAVTVLQAHPTRNSLGRLASSHCRILLYRRSRV